MRRLLALGTLALLASCANATVSDVDPFVGLYNLVSIDGSFLPVLGSDAASDPRREVMRVDVTLGADHSASRVEYTRVTPAGQSSTLLRDERSGTFAIKGDVITITFPGAAPYTGSIGGEVMFLTQDSRSVQFYKRDRTFE
jgi:hypothetical protein